jgi:hypothetical protein
MMIRWLGIAALGLLVGCAGGARDVDYPPDRGISADIAATHSADSSSLFPGMNTSAGEDSEPLGLFPWQLGERHQQ